MRWRRRLAASAHHAVLTESVVLEASVASGVSSSRTGAKGSSVLNDEVVTTRTSG